jgi:hypothetical protein
MAGRRIIILLVYIVVSFVFAMSDVYGQPPSGPPGNPPPPGVPITGIEYLLGGGIAYGIRSLLKARKK